MTSFQAQLREQVEELCWRLKELGSEVKEAVAHVVSRSVADAVRDLIAGLLQDPRRLTRQRENDWDEWGDEERDAEEPRRWRWSSLVSTAISGAVDWIRQRATRPPSSPVRAATAAIITGLATLAGVPSLVTGIGLCLLATLSP